MMNRMNMVDVSQNEKVLNSSTKVTPDENFEDSDESEEEMIPNMGIFSHHEEYLCYQRLASGNYGKNDTSPIVKARTRCHRRNRKKECWKNQVSSKYGDGTTDGLVVESNDIKSDVVTNYIAKKLKTSNGLRTCNKPLKGSHRFSRSHVTFIKKLCNPVAAQGTTSHLNTNGSNQVSDGVCKKFLSAYVKGAVSYASHKSNSTFAEGFCIKSYSRVFLMLVQDYHNRMPGDPMTFNRMAQGLKYSDISKLFVAMLHVITLGKSYGPRLKNMELIQRQKSEYGGEIGYVEICFRQPQEYWPIIIDFARRRT